MIPNKDLVKEYINSKYNFRYKVEVINSINIEKIGNSEKSFFLIDWSGWRLQADSLNWNYKNGLKSLRFNVDDFNLWLIERRNSFLEKLE